MGCCTSRYNDDDDTEPEFGARRIQSLKQHSWTSATPMTRSVLEKEHEEFWETSPEYGGKLEAWQAIRAACEERDPTLVQAILDAGRITVPSNRAVELTTGQGSSGSRAERSDPMAQFTCFDHLGNMYVVPVKFISAPKNLIEDGHAAAGHEGDGSAGEGSSLKAQETLVNNQGVSSKAPLKHSSDSVSTVSTGQGSSKKDKSKQTDTRRSISNEPPTETVRVRLSNAQKDKTLAIHASVRVGQIKELLLDDPSTQLVRGQSRLRVFFLGRILEDKEQLRNVSHFELGPQGTVLQVQVSNP
ncbi:Ubiquitin domain-containing protein 2 [Podila epigama]|nr:Ubiquitin domain-containing protein 2 [Podila epigama]